MKNNEQEDDILITKYGFCKFDKFSENFVLDNEKTDPCFFEWPYADYEVVTVRAWLKSIKRRGLEFPERIAIATG